MYFSQNFSTRRIPYNQEWTKIYVDLEDKAIAQRTYQRFKKLIDRSLIDAVQMNQNKDSVLIVVNSIMADSFNQFIVDLIRIETEALEKALSAYEKTMNTLMMDKLKELLGELESKI